MECEVVGSNPSLTLCLPPSSSVALSVPPYPAIPLSPYPPIPIPIPNRASHVLPSSHFLRFPISEEYLKG